MSGTERDDVETLATLLLDGIRDAMPFPTSTDEWITVTRVVRSILARELAQHDAAVAAKAVAEALAPIRELADLWDERRAPNGRPMLTTANVVDRLRAALAAAEGTET